MRNAGLVLAAVAVLVVGLVLVQGADDEGSSAAGTASVEATTPAASAPTVSTPAASTPSTPADTTPTTPAPAPKVPTLVFAGGKVEGGVRKLSFTKGDQVRFRVRSDVAEEIHVHGFDKKQDVAAGGTVSFAFPASFDGIFEVEVEGSGTQLASLEIQP